MLDFIENKLYWIIAIFTVVYIYLKYYAYSYWKRHGVPHEAPSIPLGNIKFAHFLGKISIGNVIKENYEKYKHYPFHGFYAFFRPVLVINDPELIRTVLIKEFHRFPDRGWYSNEKVDPISSNLFLLPGEKWKILRGKLSPIFTSGKLKQMHQLLAEVSNEMISTCESDLQKSNILELKDILARYTTDVISSIVYGFNCNSLKNPKSEFRHYGIKSLDFGRLNLIIGIFLPDLLKGLSLPLNSKDVIDFFVNILTGTMDYRRKEKVVRKDFVNLLMQLLDHGKLEDDGEESITSNGTNIGDAGKINMNEAAAQAFVFFVAGYETASSTVTYCLLELAMNPEIQVRLQQEIDSTAENPGLNYDSIMGMEYLEMVFTETLRKHPSVPFLNRICIEDYRIPDLNFTIQKDTRILISASGIHRNPEFYPDPEKFDPLRFSKDNAASLNNYVYLGFGGGPRYCIGKRFGIMEAKYAIVTMLQNYTFSVSEKTEIPVKYATDNFVQTPESGVYLRVEKRNRINKKL